MPVVKTSLIECKKSEKFLLSLFDSVIKNFVAREFNKKKKKQSNP